MAHDDADVLLVEVSDRIATVTMNRPRARNALNHALRRALRDAFRALDADDGVDVIVLTGADPAFCAGLDLKELGASSGPSGPSSDAVGHGTLAERSPLPPTGKLVIGAVNGVAITGGFEVALRCDLLVASDRARFADTHARVGIMPDWGLTVLLPQAIGVRRARQLSATGNFLDAATAERWGLVNHVVPHDELLPFARRLAADVVSNDQRAVRRILRTYAEGMVLPMGEAWQLEADVSDAWQGGGIDAATVEARRAAVTARGRTQL
jgi:enoyl-CoA hydratase